MPRRKKRAVPAAVTLDGAERVVPAAASVDPGVRLIGRAAMTAKLGLTMASVYKLVQQGILPRPCLPGRWYEPAVNEALAKLHLDTDAYATREADRDRAAKSAPAPRKVGRPKGSGAIRHAIAEDNRRQREAKAA